MKACFFCSTSINTEEVRLKNRYNADRQATLKICPDCRRKLRMLTDLVFVTITPADI